jgi:hypothetical protein
MLDDIVDDLTSPLIDMFKDWNYGVCQAAVATVQQMLQFGKGSILQIDYVSSIPIASSRSSVKDAVPLLIDMIRDGAPLDRSNAATVLNSLASHGKLSH